MSAPAIPTFGPPPPPPETSSPIQPSLPLSIISIAPPSSDNPSPTPTNTQQSTSTSQAAPTTPATSTDSETASTGSSTADSTSVSSAPLSSGSSTTSMSSQSSSAVPPPISLSPSPSPPLVAATSHSNHAGAIAGGVIGGVAFIALVIGAVLFALRRNNRQKAQQNILPWSSGGVGRRRGDVRISSSSGLAGAVVGDRNSGYGFAKRMSGAGFAAAGGDYASKSVPGGEPGRRGSTMSAAGIPPRTLHHDTSVSSHTHVNSHSVEDAAMGYSDDEEKGSTLQNHDSLSYSHANKSLDLTDPAVPHLPMEPPSVFPYQERSRTRSVTGHNRALTLAKLDSSVPVVTPHSNFSPTDGASISRSPSAATYSSQKDPFASPTDKALNRMSSGGGASRRPTVTRKAVPKYDKSEFSMSDMSSSSPASPTRATSPLPMHQQRTPTPPGGMPAVAARAVSPYTLSRSSSNGSMRAGSGASRNGSSSNLHVPLPALNHKTSFGDMRPVHYLIPDMPPPQQE